MSNKNTKDYEKISLLLSANDIEAAYPLIISAMEREGFNDTLAVFVATINLSLGNVKEYYSMLKKGLEYNPLNYELHLMLGGYYENENNISKAYREYELALRYSEYENGESHEDTQLILETYLEFKAQYGNAILDYVRSLPILIYKSEDICYGLLNHFADMIAKELKNKGETVEVVDVTVTPIESLSNLSGRRYKAILGIQSYLFSVQFKDGRNMHDFILGPKFNMLFDHPACMYNHFTKGPKDYYILTHDRNYVEYINQHYVDIRKTYILPPAGELTNKNVKKEYDLTFIGSYKAPDTWDYEIAILDKEYDKMASKLVECMIENPNLTYEEAVDKINKKSNSTNKLYFDLKQTYFKVMSEYRKRILETILSSGIEVHVFGDSWREDTWGKFENLIVHEDVDFDTSLEIYAKSKMSLNIMSWHKDGRTERIANIMLNKSLAISDKTDYLEENYKNDMVLFDLKDFSNLPNKIKEVLGNKKMREDMVEGAYKKAVVEDTWRSRTSQLLEIIGQCEI